MIDDVERLDSALNRQRIGAGLEGVSPVVAALVDVAVEVAESFSGYRLTAADHDRIYAESVLRLEAALRESQSFWSRVHLGRRGAAALGGAAAATVVTIAAIGIVTHGRHKHRDRIAAAAAA